MFERFLNWIGYGLCHQLPERSFFGGGLQVPVCARDTGIYVGFVISMAIVAWLHRGQRPSQMPRSIVWVAALFMVAFMAWDGVTSYAGLRTTTNALRLLTGLSTGYAVSVLLLPLLNDELWRYPGPGRVLDGPGSFSIWLISLPAAFFALWFAAPLLGQVYPVLVALAIVATLSAINLLIVAMLPWFDRRAVRWQDLVVPSAIAVAISLLEIGIAGALRAVLQSAAGLIGGA